LAFGFVLGPWGVRRMTLFSSAMVCGCLLGAIMTNQLLAQVPTQLPSGMTPEQAMLMLRQNPQLGAQLRQRLQQSGLTPDQIRAQLAANGYPPNMLDAYMGSAPMGGAAQPGAQELSAFEALGISLDQGLRVDTGAIFARAPAVSPESLAAGNYVFGVDVFGRATTQFLPVLAGPVSPDYRVGPGDRLVVILTGDVERSYTLLVGPEGFVLIPLAGQVFVSNLTVHQVTDVLYSRLQRVYSKLGRDAAATTHLDVVVASVRVNQVSVIGEVSQPGAYQISALGSALTALYTAGGVTSRANMRRIEIRRLDSLVATLDLYDYLLRGSTRANVRLEAGDVVFVPLHGTRVQVTGAVLRPAVYELSEGETLPDLLRAAGGFRAMAALDRLTIHRILPAAERMRGTVFRTAIDVPLAAVSAADPPTSSTTGGTSGHSSAAADDVVAGMAVPALRLDDGDSVAVDSLPPLSSQLYVEIAGMVNKPGRYPWREGMTLRDLILLARGTQIGAYLKDVEIARLPADRSRAQLADTIRAPIDSTYLFERRQAGRYVGPAGPAFTGSGAPEVLLQPFDNVLVLKQPDFELQRTVQVLGEVRFPGTYSLRSKNERLMDVIDRAGGLTAQAYPNGIRFYRTQDSSGRVGVDLVKLLKHRTDKDNLVLADRDSLYVPAYWPIVRVEGAVNSPRSVTYVPGQDLDYYLNAAGGVAATGDKKRVFVQQPNGNVRAVHKRGFLLGTSKPTPEPGALVMVPVRDTTARSNSGATLSGIAQIVTALTTIVVVLATTRK
jgi:polysaccharide export outer membrane protein